MRKNFITPCKEGFKMGRDFYLDGKRITGGYSDKASKKFNTPYARIKFQKGFTEGYDQEKESDTSIIDTHEKP